MIPYLTFRIADELYAIPLDAVSEIATYPEGLARVPTAPSWIRGLFNLRGRVIPAIDLAAKLGIVANARSKRTCTLLTSFVVDGVPLGFGMIVDAVEDLMSVDPERIEPPPAFGSSLRIASLMGTVREGPRIICLLDLVKLFRDEELMEAALTEERQRAESAQSARVHRAAEAAAMAAARAEAATSFPSLEGSGIGIGLSEGAVLFDD